MPKQLFLSCLCLIFIGNFAGVQHPGIGGFGFGGNFYGHANGGYINPVSNIVPNHLVDIRSDSFDRRHIYGGMIGLARMKNDGIRHLKPDGNIPERVEEVAGDPNSKRNNSVNEVAGNAAVEVVPNVMHHSSNVRSKYNSMNFWIFM